MNIARKRQRIKESIDRLSPEELDKVAGFIEDLMEGEDESATEEPLPVADFSDSFHRSLEQLRREIQQNGRGVR